MRLLHGLIMITSSTALISQHLPSIGSSKILGRILFAQKQRSNNLSTSNTCRQSIYFVATSSHHFNRIQRNAFTSLSSKLIEEETMSAPKRAKIKNEESDDDDFVLSEEQTEEDYINSLPEGISKGHHIISHATVPESGFPMEQLLAKLNEDEIKRLEITSTNVNVPVALMMLFPEEFGTLTRARKECRRKKIIVLRCKDQSDGADTGASPVFDRNRMIIGKVIDRVMAGDTIAIQTRTTNGGYEESRKHDKDPPFHLPVVYQDDHIAIVNKPEGVVVFGHKNGGYGRHTVKAALPYVLDPPKIGTMSILWNPMPVHRIDKATSGLLVVAKTKPAMVHLSKQFRDRKVKKTYTAIINGIPPEPKESSLTSTAAKELGVCIEKSCSSKDEDPMWQLINKDLEEQSAVTIWRTLGKRSLENALNSTVTMVELKPKTGRFHQLRRHMAWVCNCPIIGDKTYDGAGKATQLREEGLFLCSNRVTLEHPFYNTKDGQSKLNEDYLTKKTADACHFTEDDDGTVLVNVEIDLPEKFHDMMKSTSLN